MIHSVGTPLKEKEEEEEKKLQQITCRSVTYTDPPLILYQSVADLDNLLIIIGADWKMIRRLSNSDVRLVGTPVEEEKKS
jgi:hypothetical protein